jgi:peptidoglycan hydrolase CwlO-like protein
MIEISLAAAAIPALIGVIAVVRQVARQEADINNMKEDVGNFKIQMEDGLKQLAGVAESQRWIKESLKEMNSDIKHIRKNGH